MLASAGWAIAAIVLFRATQAAKLVVVGAALADVTVSAVSPAAAIANAPPKAAIRRPKLFGRWTGLSARCAASSIAPWRATFPLNARMEPSPFIECCVENTGPACSGRTDSISQCRLPRNRGSDRLCGRDDVKGSARPMQGGSTHSDRPPTSRDFHHHGLRRERTASPRYSRLVQWDRTLSARFIPQGSGDAAVGRDRRFGANTGLAGEGARPWPGGTIQRRPPAPTGSEVGDGPRHPIPRRAVLAGVGRGGGRRAAAAPRDRARRAGRPRRTRRRTELRRLQRRRRLRRDGDAAGHRQRRARADRRLSSTVATDDPVTRGICEVDPSGHLGALTERRKVARQADGMSFRSEDGVEPALLSGDLPTSVNLWDFQPAIWDVFKSAMDANGLDEDALIAELAAGGELPGVEVLLPEVVATMVADGVGLPARVLTTDARLVGVTHAVDLAVVSAELARQVAWGIRPSSVFSDAG